MKRKTTAAEAREPDYEVRCEVLMHLEKPAVIGDRVRDVELARRRAALAPRQQELAVPIELHHAGVLVRLVPNGGDIANDLLIDQFGDALHERGDVRLEPGIAPAVSGVSWRTLTATHPSLEQRLEQLAKVATELGRPMDGGFTSGTGV